ncbi:DmsC/YnfH family molybdoenzyme membrane anchor subunit, partial [Klebsiella pneumoniae]
GGWRRISGHSQQPRATGLLIGLLLVLIAECIGRGLFYGLHMTVGMAVAG